MDLAEIDTANLQIDLDALTDQSEGLNNTPSYSLRSTSGTDSRHKYETGNQNYSLVPTLEPVAKTRRKKSIRLPPSPEKKAERNQKERQRREKETEEQRETRLERARQRGKQSRANETPDQREARLEKQRSRAKERRARETSSETEKRNQENRLRGRVRWLKETNEMRLERLQRKRTSAKTRRDETKKLRSSTPELM